MDLVKEIKNKSDLISIIASANGMRPNEGGFIHSIYKDEKTPSLKLYPETNSYYCFATNTGGDVIKFVADFKKITNAEAIKLIADELKLNTTTTQIPKYEPSTKTAYPEYDEQIQKRVYNLFYQYCNDAGNDPLAYEYLINTRGLSADTLQKHKVFTIRNVNNTVQYLKSVFCEDELKYSGLFNDKGKFLFYYHRIVIPYLINGQISYMRARYFCNGGEGRNNKYLGLLNSAGNLTSKQFYNVDILKALKPTDSLIITEGEFDGLTISQQGYNYISIAGVGNMPKDISSLKNYNLYLCFDSDTAGKEAVQKIAKRFEQPIKIITLKKHKDLSDLFNDVKDKYINLFEDNEYISICSNDYELKPNELGINLISAYEIQQMQIKPINWIIENFLPEGLAILAGKPKQGKSWLCLNLAIAMAEQTKAFNFYETEKHGVLYLSYEDNYRRIQERISKITGNRLVKGELYFQDSKDLPYINEESGLNYLTNVIRKYPNIKLIVIDTLAKAIKQKRSVNNNAYLDDYELTAKLQTFAIHNGICILLVHHTRKAISENVFDSISGTTGITAAQDTMLVLKKELNGKVNLYLTGRDVFENTFELNFNKENCTWEIKGTASEIQKSESRQEIIDLFENDFERVLTLKEIATALGKTQSNISHIIKKMTSVESADYGKYRLTRINNER